MHVDGVWAMKVVADSGLTRKEFADRAGVTDSTVRSAFSAGRLTRRMREELHRMANALTVDGLEPEPEPEPEGERMAVVCSVPRNPHIRLVEFPDGVRGRFRCRVGEHLMGSRVRLKPVGGDVWERVGEYDRRGRLVE